MGPDLPAWHKSENLSVSVSELSQRAHRRPREPKRPRTESTVLVLATCQKALFTTTYLRNILFQASDGKEYFKSISWPAFHEDRENNY